MRSTAFLYALALVLLPFSAGMKQIFELATTIWIAPALLLGVVIFIFGGAGVKDRRAFSIAIFAMVSGLIGSFLFPPSIYREHSSFYAFYAEPIRVCLNVIWYLVSVKLVIEKESLVIKWLSVSVAIQLLIAAYMYLALYEIVVVPDVVALYLAAYKTRQTFWFGDSPVYRMSGTFFEGPPFGLFMLTSLIIFVLHTTRAHAQRAKAVIQTKWLVLGIVSSIIGAILSLSDAVLLGLLVFCVAWYVFVRPNFVVNRPGAKVAEATVVVLLACSFTFYMAQRVVAKWQLAKAPIPVNDDVMYDSGAERMFHIRYGLGRLTEEPLAVLTGIGPGRYGDYVARTGMFPPTVNIAVMPVEWIVEYGILGLGVILYWVWGVGIRARKTYGAIGTGALFALLIANSGQANWLWETWFLAMAFLYSSGKAIESQGVVPYFARLKPEMPLNPTSA